MSGVPLCTCFGFSEEDLKKIALDRGLTTPAEITRAVSAGGGCRTCVPDLEKLLEALWAGRAPKPRDLTPDSVVRDALQPFLGKGAWELELVEVDGPEVRLRAIPRREACAEAENTLRNFVEKRLKESYRPDATATFV